MPSIPARLCYYALKLFLRGRNPLDITIKELGTTYVKENGPQTLPKSVLSEASVTFEETTFKCTASQEEWQIFTMLPKRFTGSKVIIYFHGGGFIAASGGPEYKIALKMARDYDCAVIFPNWSLAPISCAAQFALTSVALVSTVASDPRYQGKDIILAGGSAGGWCALKTLLSLCENELIRDVQSRLIEPETTLPRIAGVMLFCAVVDAEVTADVKAIESHDPMLSGDVITKLGDLWFRGPAGYPDIMAIIPQDLRERAKLWAQDVEGAPLTDSRLSLRHGLDVIKDYMELSHRFRPFIFSSFVGSYDVVAAGNKVMHQQLKDMGERFVLEDLTLAEGLFHGYMGLPLPETRQLWRRVGEILLAPNLYGS